MAIGLCGEHGSCTGGTATAAAPQERLELPCWRSLRHGVLTCCACCVQFKSPLVLSSASKQHLVVAWLAGALMAWLAESYRRCTFAGQHAAKLAHSKELAEKMRHLRAQEELASAREEVRTHA